MAPADISDTEDNLATEEEGTIFAPDRQSEPEFYISVQDWDLIPWVRGDPSPAQRICIGTAGRHSFDRQQTSCGDGGDSLTSFGDDRCISCHLSSIHRFVFVDEMSSLGALWTIAHSALYGFHIASLNGVQDAVTCGDRGIHGKTMGLRYCLDLTDSSFGVAVTIFTLGGLLGSLSGDMATRRYGRVGVLRISELVFAIGTAFVGLANGIAPLIIGRILIGIASGFVLVSVPLHLSEIAPKRYSRLFGTLHQMSIGLGMIVAQSLSIPFAQPFRWRYVLLIGELLAILLLLSSTVVRNAKNDRRTGEEQRLLEDDHSDEDDQDDISVRELFTTENNTIRKALLVVVAAQFGQQVCGISPVMYFSSKILSPVFQGDSKLVALFVMAIGIPFNFVPGFLPESFGTKRMLLLSSTLTTLFSILLAIGLNQHLRALSGLSVIGFVISFSIGLAPLAWVVLPEVMPKEGRTAGGSVAVSVNWLTNFAAGSTFLPLQQALKHGDSGEGNIFFVFAAASVVAFSAIAIAYRLFEYRK